MMQISRTYGIVALWALACATSLASWFLHSSNDPLGYDEADYVRAVQKGFFANWSDADEISPVEFVQTGVKALNGEISRSQLSAMVRERPSTMFLRHYHPPLALYPAFLTQHLAPQDKPELGLRLAMVAWCVAGASLIALLAYKTPAGTVSPWVVLVPASTSLAQSLTGFNMHVPFGILALLTVLLWRWYEQSGKPAARLLTSASMAATLATVEYGLPFAGIMILVMGIRFFRSQNRSGYLRQVLSAAATTIAFLTVLWPGGIIQMGLLRSYIFQAYIAIKRLPDEKPAFESAWSMISVKWNSSPVELVLGMVILLLCCGWIARLWRSSPVLTGSTLFCVAVAVLQRNPVLSHRWYLFPLFCLAFGALLPWVIEQFPKFQLAKFRALPVVTAALLWSISTVAFSVPIDLESRALLLWAQHSKRAVTIPSSVSIRLAPYGVPKYATPVHDVEFKGDGADSVIAVSRSQGDVLVPAEVARTLRLPASDTLGSFVVVPKL